MTLSYTRARRLLIISFPFLLLFFLYRYFISFIEKNQKTREEIPFHDPHWRFLADEYGVDIDQFQGRVIAS